MIVKFIYLLIDYFTEEFCLIFYSKQQTFYLCIMALIFLNRPCYIDYSAFKANFIRHI